MKLTPVPGTGRCALCGETLDAEHVPHPPAQVFAWLLGCWHWRMVFGLFALSLTVSLAIIIAVIRNTLTT